MYLKKKWFLLNSSWSLPLRGRCKGYVWSQSGLVVVRRLHIWTLVSLNFHSSGNNKNITLLTFFFSFGSRPYDIHSNTPVEDCLKFFESPVEFPSATISEPLKDVVHSVSWLSTLVLEFFMEEQMKCFIFFFIHSSWWQFLRIGAALP